MMEWDLKGGCCLTYNGVAHEIFGCVVIFSVYSALYLFAYECFYPGIR